jgi:hypothetical protein
MKNALQLLFFTIYTASGLYAQKKITVSYESTPLHVVLRDLHSKAQISYIADIECLKQTHPITLKSSLSIDDLLQEIFAQQPVDYHLTRNCIIVKPRNITGKVIDQHEEPISGVRVLGGAGQATMTNNNGCFVLRQASCDSLIRFLYPPTSETIRLCGKTNIVVIMNTVLQTIEMLPIDSNSASIPKTDTIPTITFPLLKHKKNG